MSTRNVRSWKWWSCDLKWKEYIFSTFFLIGYGILGGTLRSDKLRLGWLAKMLVTFILMLTNSKHVNTMGIWVPQKWSKSCPYIIQYSNFHDRPTLLYYQAYQLPAEYKHLSLCVCVCVSLRSCPTEMRSVWECYMSLRRRLRSCAVRAHHLQACADTCLMDSIPWWETQSLAPHLHLTHTHFFFYIIYFFQIHLDVVFYFILLFWLYFICSFYFSFYLV